MAKWKGALTSRSTQTIQQEFASQFRLKPTYFFDGSNQSLEEWIEREIPGVKVLIETVTSLQNDDLCTAKVKIT